MHYSDFIFVYLNSAFPLLMFLADQVHCLVAVALGKGCQDVSFQGNVELHWS